MTDGSQEFCLRWNNHQATIISVFDYLLENETLVDCTLAAEGQYLKAHKVVLCACSPYLELLLSQHNDKHPILIFKDIKYNELKCMIEYMYKGEVNIAQDQLNHFLKAAESLQIKGLSESEEDAAPQTSIPAPRPPPPRAPPVQRTQPRPISSSVAVESPKRINRNEAASPTRKRRRLPIQGRPSLSGDDASNASESHLDQSNCDVPSNVQPSSDNAVAKLETNSELILEPKTEYDDNSVEDITLDDDEEDYSQAGTSMDNSQMNFSGWQGMDKSGGDEVFTGQDSGAQNSQEHSTCIEGATIQDPVKKNKPLKSFLRSARSEMKKRRDRGQEYFDYKGNFKPARRMKPCLDKCKRNCKNKHDDAYRQRMFDDFWSLKDYSLKCLFITKLIDVSETKRTRRRCNDGSPSPRQFTFRYNLGTNKEICLKCFLSTFDLHRGFLHSAIQKSFRSELPTDNRGGPRKKGKKLESAVNEIENSDDSDSETVVADSDGCIDEDYDHALDSDEYEEDE